MNDMTRLFFLIILLAATALPLPSLAADGIDIDNCTSNSHEDWHFSSKIVDCVETSINDAVIELLGYLSNYMTPIVGAMLTLATAIFGMQMMAGMQDARAKILGFALRAGFVVFFYYNLGGFSASIFAIEDELISIVSAGDPWITIDTFLLGILGGSPDTGLDLTKGVVGIIGASLFSTTAAGIMAFIGLSAIINFLLFVFRVVFVYLTAITMIGFLLAISPLVIPMALFAQHTEPFFKKWLDILLSAMLVPVLLFAFLNLFLMTFTVIGGDIRSAFCQTPGCASDPEDVDLRAFFQQDKPVAFWGVASDPTLSSDITVTTGSESVGIPAIQSNMVSSARRTHDVFSLTAPGVSFGPAEIQIIKDLIYFFVLLWIYSSFMKSLIEKIPDVAYSITEASSYISLGPTQIEQQLQTGLRGVQSAITGRR